MQIICFYSLSCVFISILLITKFDDIQKELISKFICSKIYTHFVNPSVNENFIEKLSEFFIESEFNLEPLLRKLFKSEHFFDSYNRSVLIKEPIDLLCSIHNHLKFSLLDDFDFDDL